MKRAAGDVEKHQQKKRKKEGHANRSTIQGALQAVRKDRSRREGGDADAYVTGENIAKGCLAPHKAGKRTGNQPFMKCNAMAKRVELMHLEGGFDEFSRMIDTADFEAPAALATPAPTPPTCGEDAPRRPEQPNVAAIGNKAASWARTARKSSPKRWLQVRRRSGRG